MRTSSFIRSRNQAYERQEGLCFYCGSPMWSHDPTGFATKYGLTPRQTGLLQCTGEHLIARKDGGGGSQANIVAACKLCNTRRHKRKTPPQPEVYKQLVQKRIARGGWHTLELLRLLTKTTLSNHIEP